METFSALLAICAGNSPASGEFPAQRPVTRSFDIFCDLRLNKRFSEQSWGWWFEGYRAHYDVIVMNTCSCHYIRFTFSLNMSQYFKTDPIGVFKTMTLDNEISDLCLRKISKNYTINNSKCPQNKHFVDNIV